MRLGFAAVLVMEDVAPHDMQRVEQWILIENPLQPLQKGACEM
jgi:hypothetical protein